MTELLIDLAPTSPIYARAESNRRFKPVRFHRVTRLYLQASVAGGYAGRRAIFACGFIAEWPSLTTWEPDKAYRCKRCWT